MDEFRRDVPLEVRAGVLVRKFHFLNSKRSVGIFCISAYVFFISSALRAWHVCIAFISRYKLAIVDESVLRTMLGSIFSNMAS